MKLVLLASPTIGKPLLRTPQHDPITAQATLCDSFARANSHPDVKVDSPRGLYAKA
jgi:hypothetical protein